MEFLIMKIHKLSLISLLLSSTAVTIPASFADEQAKVDVEEIIVTANRRKQSLSDVGSSISVITDVDIEQGQHVFVLSALENVAGVSISQSGAFGGTASLSIRGSGGDNTMLLVDGVQMNDTSAPGGAFDFGALDSGDISRIEILKGPQSVLYGSDAIGGVVNIITKTGEDGYGGGVSTEVGSFNTHRLTGQIFGGTEKLGFNLSGSRTTSDGISAADEADGNTERDGYAGHTLSGKITGRANEALGFDLIGRYSKAETDYDDFGPVDGDNVADTKNHSLAARVFFPLLKGRLTNTLSAEASGIDRKTFMGAFEGFGAKGTRINLDYLGVYEMSQTLTLTAGLQSEMVKAKSVSDEKFGTDSVFAELGYSAGNLTFTGGMRRDDHDDFGAATTGRVTGSYEVATGTRLIANYGSAFKAPSIFQLTYICGFCGLTEPTQGLQPEKAKAYEIGVEQELADGGLILTATYFHQKSRDAIGFTFTGGYQNIGLKKSEGVELSFNAKVSENFSLTGNFTHLTANDLVADVPILREPKTSGFIMASWQVMEKLSTSISITHNGKEDDFGGGDIQGWIRLDVRASFKVKENLHLFARVDNALGEQYQHVLGFGTPGFSAFGGFRIKY
jgi:vitamin B12 transporter